jgi:membrane protein
VPVCKHVAVANFRAALSSFSALPFVSPAIEFARDFVVRFGKLNVSLLSGGLAYYVILAVAPIAISVGAIAGLFIGKEQFVAGWDSLIGRGPESLSSLDSVVNSLSSLAQSASTGTVTFTTIVSLFLAVYVSQKVVYGILRIQDHIFNNDRPPSGLFFRVISAVIALVMIIAIVVVLLAVTFVPVFLSSLNVENTFLELLDTLGWLTPAIFVYLLVWFVMRLTSGPRGVVTWRSPGLLVATTLIILSIGAFGIYANQSSTVGSALVVFGAPIALLIWSYLVFLGFFIGSIVEGMTRDRALARKPTRRTTDKGDDESADSGANARADYGDPGK